MTNLVFKSAKFLAEHREHEDHNNVAKVVEGIRLDLDYFPNSPRTN